MTNPPGEVIDLAVQVAKRLQMTPEQRKVLITRAHRHPNYFRECLRYVNSQRHSPTPVSLPVSPEAS